MDTTNNLVVDGDKLYKLTEQLYAALENKLNEPFEIGRASCRERV